MKAVAPAGTTMGDVFRAGAVFSGLGLVAMALAGVQSDLPDGLHVHLAAAVERFGSGDPAEPDLEGLVAIDAEVRSFAEAYR